MDPELKRKWIKALRSGKYKQGRGQLWRKSDNSYCCLGVLEAIQGNMTPTGTIHGTLSAIARESAQGYYIRNLLAYMNDQPESSFKAIADYIENSFSL